MQLWCKECSKVHKFPCQPLDELVNGALEFFETRDFNQNIVDVLVQDSADALKINLFIDQHNNDAIQVNQIKSGLSILCKEVHLNFSGSSESSLETTVVPLFLFQQQAMQSATTVVMLCIKINNRVM